MVGGASQVLRFALTPLNDGEKLLVGGLPYFNNAFSTCCTLLFTAPVVKAIFLVNDPLVSFWLGFRPKVVVLMPIVFIFVSYLIQQVAGSPMKRALVLNLIGGSLVLGLQANQIAVNALVLSNSFAASDCENYTLKYGFENAWLAAHEFRKGCSPNTRDPLAPDDGLIQHCEGYKKEATTRPAWAFLWNLEERYACAGWCKPREPLWVISHTTQDSCSTVVAQVLSAKIQRDSMQLAIYNIIMLTISVVAIIGLGPTLKAHGIGW